MGCDVHFAAEAKGEDGRWHWTALPINKDRNYDLFAILADVRNGRGFAGVETGQGFVPISEPRGFPADMDPASHGPEFNEDEEIPWEEYKEKYYRRIAPKGVDYHSESWLLASEIFNYDYDQRTLICGVMSEKEYLEYAETGVPVNYSGGVSGAKVEVVNEPVYRSMMAGRRPRDPNIEYFVKSWWEVTYQECLNGWVENLKEQLLAAGYTDFDKVRLVFSFDN